MPTSLLRGGTGPINHLLQILGAQLKTKQTRLSNILFSQEEILIKRQKDPDAVLRIALLSLFFVRCQVLEIQNANQLNQLFNTTQRLANICALLAGGKGNI